MRPAPLAALALGAAALLGARPGPCEASDDGVLTRLYVVDDGPGARGSALGGIPIPRALALTDTAELRVARESVDGDGRVHREPVPAQWRVLSRWGGPAEDTRLPIRWVLADVDAPPDAALVLVRGGATSGAEPRLAHETEHGVVVDDGRLSFHVPYDRFAPLAHPRWRESDFDRAHETALADDGLDVRLRVRGERGQIVGYRPAPSPPEIVLEDTGPLRATIRVRAELVREGREPAAGAGLRVDLTLTAVRGGGTAAVDVSLHNGTGSRLDVHSFSVVLPTRWSGPLHVASELGVLEGAGVGIVQSHELRDLRDEEATLTVDVSVAGRAASHAGRIEGVFTVSSESHTLGVRVARFWQSHPKGVAFGPGRCVLDVLPAGGSPHVVAPGRRVGSSLVLDSAPRSDVDAGRRWLVPDVEWTTASGVVAPLGVAEGVGDDVLLETAVRHLARLRRGLVDVAVCDPQGPRGQVAPASIATQRERRGAANPSLPYDVDLLGWRSFGDLVDADGLARGDHGWVAGLCRAFLEERDPRHLAAALDLARLRVETSGSAAPGPAAVEGLLLAHTMTGEEDLLLAARRLAGDSAKWSGPRAVEALLALHEHDGDRGWLLDALRHHRALLSSSEGPSVSRLDADALRALRAHMRVHAVTGDARALAALLRRLRHVVDDGLAGTGRAVGEAYLPLQVHAPDHARALPFPAGIGVADALAYASRVTGRTEYLEQARAIFRDAVLFLQAPAMQPVVAGYHAPVGVAPLRYPGREIAYGEMLLDGAPWLRAGSARSGLRDEHPEGHAGEVLLRTAEATAAGTRTTGADSGTSSEGPASPDDSQPAEAPGPRTVDEAEGVRTGHWESRVREDALGGSQSVSPPGAGDSRLSFRVPVRDDGRVRVLVRWWPVREPAARAHVRIGAASGTVGLEIDTARGAGRWRLLGEFDVRADAPLSIEIRRAGTAGALPIDGVRVEPVR
jgi:hypothetical protein